jgi:hypothetical protein
MQIRVALILLITSTFVIYARKLPDDAAIRIYMFLQHLFLSIKTIYSESILVKASFLFR